jgi:lipoprotein-anchoring transpeptidase ErfK/SrfK
MMKWRAARRSVARSIVMLLQRHNANEALIVLCEIMPVLALPARNKIRHYCVESATNRRFATRQALGIIRAHFFEGIRMLRVVFAAATAAMLSAGAASASVMYDPLTGRTVDANISHTGRAYATPIPRETVNYAGPHRPGTIVVNTQERRLYLVMEGGKALRYGVGVGRPGFSWGGSKTVTRKAEWPSWTPPAQMLRRRPDLPRFMPGGPENPMGARALYLGSSLYRIHGSNEPETIGQAVSSGCIRMLNEDVIDLYSRVRVGARVVVMR